MRLKQLPLPIRERHTHGGSRPGAGRPKRSKLQSHVRRTEFASRHPLHVTVRLRDGLPSLRRRELFNCFKQAVRKARSQGLAIAHFAVLSNHMHLVLEAPDRRNLARQMQSLGVSLAKRLNSHLARKGAVLLERYHVHVLRTPREVRNALAYVLSNAFKHAGSKGRVQLDSFSSAVTVKDPAWAQLLGRRWRSVVGFPEEDSPGSALALLAEVESLLSRPRTWLLSRGWERA